MKHTQPKPLTPVEAKMEYPLRFQQACGKAEQEACGSKAMRYVHWENNQFVVAASPVLGGRCWLARYDKKGKK